MEEVMEADDAREQRVASRNGRVLVIGSVAVVVGFVAWMLVRGSHRTTAEGAACATIGAGLFQGADHACVTAEAALKVIPRTGSE